jgi:hypothetical protein
MKAALGEGGTAREAVLHEGGVTRRRCYTMAQQRSAAMIAALLPVSVYPRPEDLRGVPSSSRPTDLRMSRIRCWPG